MRLHRTIPKLFHRPRATCQRLSDLMSIDAHASTSGAQLNQLAQVRRVFFGHTHVPIYELPIGHIHYLQPGRSPPPYELCPHHL